MIKKYKIGKLILRVEAAVSFLESDKFRCFYCDSGEPDYNIYVDFHTDFSAKTDNLLYESDDRVYFTENDADCCFYKSRETKSAFYALRKTDGNSIRISIDCKYRDMLRDDVIFALSGIEELVIKNSGCIIHSSYIIYNETAVLFTGPCSIGKSTQAGLWEKFTNAVIVNGDKALIEMIDGVIYASGLPFSGSSKSCQNFSAPLKAVICLDKGKENCLRQIQFPQSFYSVYKNCYPVPFSKELTNSLIDTVSLISRKIPVYEFSCLPDESAVRCLESELF